MLSYLTSIVAAPEYTQDKQPDAAATSHRHARNAHNPKKLTAGPQRPRTAWALSQPGAVNQLSKTDAAPLPPPGPGQVCVRVHAVGVGVADVMAVLGLEDSHVRLDVVAAALARRAIASCKGESTALRESHSGPPEIPGREFVGEIVAVGLPEAGPAAVSDAGESGSLLPPPRVGQRVMGLAPHGAFATLINADARLVVPAPDGWSDEQAAAFPVETLSTYYALTRLARIERGGVLLLRDAASQLQALQILSQLDCWVLGTVDSASKLKLLQLMHGDNPRFKFVLAGADRDMFCAKARWFLDYVTDHCTVAVRAFDTVIDPRGPHDALFSASLGLLSPAGVHLLIGGHARTPPVAMDFSVSWQNGRSLLRHPTRAAALALYYARYRLFPARVDAGALAAESKCLAGFSSSFLFTQDLDPVLVARLYGELLELRLDPPHVGAAYDFDDLPLAVEHVQAQGAVGKVIVRVRDPLVGLAGSDGHDSSRSTVY